MNPDNASARESESLPRRGARRGGWWAQDPYGRGRILKFIALQFSLLYGLALLPLGVRSIGASVGVMSFLCLWFAGLYAVILWSPAQRAGKEGETLVVRVTPWKRVALSVVLLLPGWLAPLYVTKTKSTPDWWWLAWLLGMLAVTAGLYWSMRDRFHVTDWGVARAVVGLGPKQKIAWSDVTRIGLWPAGITLGAPGKATISLYGIMLDGYPELVREVLRRIPHVVDATPDARERLERIAALADGSP